MPAMEKQEPEFYLLTKRDEEEKQRLNNQNNLTHTLLDGKVIDASIPKDGVHRIADIATGTGIWMNDLVAYFTKSGSGSVKREYHGFDISPDQFPKTHNPDFNFHLQDISKPFPPEWTGSFDLVHVRYLIGAFSIAQIKPLIENILTLLKPGGYLQWEDMSANGFAAAPPNAISDEIYKMYREGIEALGMSMEFLDIVKQVCVEAGLQQVIKVVPNPTSTKRVDLKEDLRKWSCDLLSAAFPPTFFRTGKAKDENEAAKMTDRVVRELKGVYGGTDVVPAFPVERVVAKKV